MRGIGVWWAGFFLGTSLGWAAPRLEGPDKWEAPPLGRQNPLVHSFTFRNRGDAPLQVREIKSTSAAVRATLQPNPIPPGGEATLRVELDGRALPEEFRQTIFLRTNDPEHPLWYLEIVGKVLGPRVEVKEQQWYVGGVAPNTSLEHTFTLRNQGAEVLHIEEVLPSHPSLTVTVEPLEVPPGEQAVVHVGWKVPSQEGVFRERILLSTNDTRQPHIEFSVVARISALLGAKGLLGQIPPDAKPVRLRFFYSSGCGVCERLMTTVLPPITRRFGEKLKVEYYDIRSEGNLELLLHLKEVYKVQEEGPAYAFIGDRCLVGSDAIENELELAVAHFLLHPTEEPDAKMPPPSKARPGSLVRQHFEEFTPWLVAAAGLADGVNPCAFATIVFFISFLTYLGRSRREMLLTGLAFTAVVFATYFLMGLGAFLALKQLTFVQWLSHLIYILAFLLLLVLAGYNLYDAAIVWTTGKTRGVKLQLPDPIKRRIHEVIRTRLTTSGLLAGVMATGFLVTLLESVCTGQTYLPTIVFVLQDPERRSRALSYLLLYNLMFIAPLVGVFLLSYLGTSSRRLAEWGQRNVIPAKVALAAVFLAMAFLLGKALLS